MALQDAGDHPSSDGGSQPAYTDAGPYQAKDAAVAPPRDAAVSSDAGRPACPTSCANEHGSADCSSGTCHVTCQTGYADCDDSAANGCEVDLTTDAVNCNGCGVVCPDTTTNARAVCQAGACALQCSDLSGSYALRLDAQASWPATTYVQSGSGTVQFWFRVTLTQTGKMLDGSAELCDQVTPETRNSVTPDRYLLAYPSALFTPGAPAAALHASLTDLTPDAGFSVARTAHVLGVMMSDPLNGTWPSFANARTGQVDHDGDGKIGVTVSFVDDASYSHAQTDASLAAARASQAYGAQRLRFAFGGSLTACTGASGTASIESFDTRTIGCRLESNQDCSATQAMYIESNRAAYSVSSSSYVMSRLGDASKSFTCAQVRSAL